MFTLIFQKVLRLHKVELKENLYMKKESRYRSIIKALSWRMIATLTTVLIAFVVTRDTSISLKIGFFEFIIKLILYYLHERLWLRVKLSDGHQVKTSAFTWRLIATITIFIIAYFTLGIEYENIFSVAITIASIEFISKISIYILHERVWFSVPIGTIRKWFEPNK